jgi:predicted metal-dependent phosphoesterase TrpH
MTMLRADMHVHTCYSRINDTIAFLGARDCYSTPEQVYRTAKSRGMDLVAITDHDTIEGALALVHATKNAPDVIVGEEVSCCYPDGPFQVHLGVYGVTETLHREIQPLRRNVFDVIACLNEADVFFCLNHLMHFWQEHVPLNRYLQLLTLVPALEVRNGAMIAKHNALSEWIASGAAFGGRRLASVAGSDAHTLRRIGTTWIEAPGRSREEFLHSVRGGLGVPAGRHGDALAVSADAYGVVSKYIYSLLGVLPTDHHGLERIGCLTFAIGSLPFEFLPLLLVARAKLAERRKVALLEAALRADLGGVATVDIRA